MAGGMFRRMAVAMLVSVGMGMMMATVTGQQSGDQGQMIPSLSESGQGLAVRARSAAGLVSFAATTGRGVLLPSMAAMPAEARALAFVELYGEPFGLRARADVRPIGRASADTLGQEHVRLQQLHQGIPVTAGELMVHLRGDRVVAANGHTLADLPPLLAPSLSESGAIEQAQSLIAKHKAARAFGAAYSEPRLEVFNRGMLDRGTYPTRLAWFIEVTGNALRQYVWVDAHTGAVLLDFSQLTEAKNRTIYNMNHDDDDTHLPGTLVRSEGQGPVADTDANQAYDYSGDTYDYYLANHGRDSYDGAGAELRSSVHFGTNYLNAFWNGQQMVYGDGLAAGDDVVGHELTHAVTERTAGLFYYYQSGALNESYSDIFGETMDLTNGRGTDTTAVRWHIGEDLHLPGFPNPLRNMMTPTATDQPGKMSDVEFACDSDGWTNQNADSGGVHTNSGVTNHAFALLVDGGTYNGRTITGIGLTKAAKIEYRVLTTYLTSGSTFLDNANALAQACTDLIGTLGITANDCAQVNNAILAVEMTSPQRCSGATPPPATYCPTGGTPVAFFSDGFESSFANWTTSSTTANNWGRDEGLAKSGVRMAYGPDVQVISDHRMAMAAAVTIPANARMSFDHLYEFEHDDFLGARYDGGVLEYSTNGTTWTDAGSLIDAGQAYNGTLSTIASNPLGGRMAFTRNSFGYTGTRLNLASLSGQTVRFRFRIGTDDGTASLGWLVDNVRLYTCSAAAAPTTNDDSYSTPFQTALQVAAPGVLGNDNSNGGGAMTASLVSNVSSGTLTLNADGGFTYTPAAGFSGTATFTYRAVNASGNGNTATVTITVGGGSTGAQPPTDLYAASIVGNLVTLRWTPPATGPAPTSYILEGGVSPGQVLASIPTGSTVPTFTVSAPSGSFYVRMHTQTASGRSGASNEIRIHVNLPVQPSAPINLLGMVNGSNIALSWTNTFGGGPPANVILDVTGSLGTSVSLGPAERFQFANVPGGTYTFTVRAQNAGGTSGASNAVTLVFPGACSGAPQAPTNFLAYKTGGTMVVTWDPPASGAAVTSYVLGVTGTFNGSFPTTGRALSGSAGPGTYNFSVQAVNACGTGPATTVQTVTLP